jgi:hypothetical protein
VSISIGHRAIFTAFGHRNNTTLGRTGPASASVLPANEKAEAPSAVDAGELRCSPWEGLYLEQAHPMTAADSEAATTRALDSFLANLMYGE